MYPLASLCLLVGAFNPFTFGVIIDKYDPVAIYFIVWVRVYKPFLGFLYREDPSAFVGKLVSVQFSSVQLLSRVQLFATP